MAQKVAQEIEGGGGASSIFHPKRKRINPLGFFRANPPYPNLSSPAISSEGTIPLFIPFHWPVAIPFIEFFKGFLAVNFRPCSWPVSGGQILVYRQFTCTKMVAMVVSFTNAPAAALTIDASLGVGIVGGV